MEHSEYQNRETKQVNENQFTDWFTAAPPLTLLPAANSLLTCEWQRCMLGWYSLKVCLMDEPTSKRSVCLVAFKGLPVTRRHGSRCEPHFGHTGTSTGCDPWQQDPTSCGDCTSINTLKPHCRPRQPSMAPTKPRCDTKTTQLENRNAWVEKRKGRVGARGWCWGKEEGRGGGGGRV